MKKLSFTDEEFKKLPKTNKKKIRKKKLSFTDEEFKNLPTEGKEDSTLGDDLVDLALMTGEGIDRITGAPTRAAMSAFMDTEGTMDALGEAGKAFVSQFGEPTSKAPTGQEVAQDIAREYPWAMPAEREPVQFGGETLPQASPEETVGLLVDMLADPAVAAKIPLKSAQALYKAVPQLHKQHMVRGGAKVLRSFLDDVSTGKVKNLMQGPAGSQEFYDRTVGAVLLQNDLAKHAGNPDALLSAIAGKPSDKITRTGKGSIVKTSRVGGKMREKMVEVSDILRKLNKTKAINEAGEVIKGTRVATGETLRDATFRRIQERSIQDGQKFLDDTAKKKIFKILDDYLDGYYTGGAEQMPLLFEEGLNPYMSLTDVNKLKQGIGKSLKDNVFKKNPSEETLKETEVLKDLYFVLKEKVEETALALDPEMGMKFIQANNDYSAMQTMKIALESQRAKELMSSGGGGMDALVSLLGGTAGGIGATVAGFNPVAGVMLGSGGASALRKGGEGIKNIFRNFGARNVGRLQSGNLLQGPAEQGAFGTLKALQSGSAIEQDFNQGRTPQSVNVNPMVDDTLLERDSDWIMKHPNMVQAKLLKEAPEMAAQVALAIAKGPSTVKKIMPQIANMMPHLFEDSDYGMFDGKIIDPNDKARYIDKVMNDSNLSSLEKAEMIDHLNRTNEVIQ